jgi:serine/threonine protein kinase
LVASRVAARAAAIKTLACDDAESRERLRREGRLLARLDHPHIVPLLDVVDCAAGVALVMEYAAGGSLAELLGQRRLTAGQLVHLAAPLADALAYAHSCGVVHADVSPANVLFTDDGRPLLADFGLSALTGPLVGAPRWPARPTTSTPTSLTAPLRTRGPTSMHSA